MKLRSGLLVFLVVLLIIFGACAAPKQPAGEAAKGEIVIGFLDDMSGPMASLGAAYVDGQNDALRYINEEKGGILGHQVRTIVVDHKMDPTLAISGWNRMKAQNVPVVFSVTAPAAVFLGESCEKDRIPIIAGGGTMEQSFPTKPSYYFVTVPQLYGVFDSFCDMVQKDWAKRGKLGVPKVCFDVISFGNYQKTYTKMSKIAAEKRGFEYIITYTSISPTDVTTQVLQAKNFGADYLYLHGAETSVIVWLKELERQNFRPVIFGSTGLAASELPKATGTLCIGTTFYAHGPQWSDTDKPGIKMLHDLNARWYPETKVRPGHYCRSFFSAVVVAEAIKRTVEKAGYENLNGDAMREALETVRGFDPAELGIKYIWTPNDHQGIRGCRWYTWTKEGMGVASSDWYEFAPLAEEQKTTAWWLQ